jgi:chromosome segregation ATPase
MTSKEGLDVNDDPHEDDMDNAVEQQNSQEDDLAYIVEVHLKKHTDTITTAIEQESKTMCSGLEKISIGQDIIKDAVTAAKDTIVDEIKNQMQHHAEELIVDVDKITDSQNGVVDSVNNLAEKQGEVENILKNQTQQMSQKVAHSEHISYKVRGQLGAQERKRRKVDLEEIGRLRAENGVLKRQLRDKDRVVTALGEHMASLDEQMHDMKETMHEMKEKMHEVKEQTNEQMQEMKRQNDTLIDLVRMLVARGN